MKRIKMRVIICCVMMLSMALSGCSALPKTGAEKESVKIALTQDLLSFDPMQTSDIFSEAVLRCVYTSLYDFDDDLNLRKKLVKSEKTMDDYTWQFEIYDDVKFHDGSPLTTDDVIFSIERARKGGRTEKLLELIDSTEKVNDTTFRIRSKEPYPNLPFLFAKAETSIVSKKVVEKEGYDFKAPVGAGPFKLKERKEGEKISLERFNDYFLETAKSKYLDFVVIVTEQERTAAFLSGDVDVLFSVSAYDCEKLKLSKDVNLLQSPSTKIEYLSLNNLHGPLDNPKVRLAISYGIDRDKITEGIYHGYSTPSSSLIPEGIEGYVASPVKYDPQKAKELLKEAGYENRFSFTVITIDTIRKNTMEYIKLDLANIGIELNYELITMKEAAERMADGEHESILVGWAFNSDPNSVLPLILGTGSGKTMNSSNYSNPVVDDLLKQGRSEKDAQKRKQIYEQVNQIVTQDAPIVILQNPMVLSAAKKNIEGLHFNPQGLCEYESLYKK